MMLAEKKSRMQYNLKFVKINREREKKVENVNISLKMRLRVSGPLGMQLTLSTSVPSNARTIAFQFYFIVIMEYCIFLSRP